jgi:hypothetical protein
MNNWLLNHQNKKDIEKYGKTCSKDCECWKELVKPKDLDVAFKRVMKDYGWTIHKLGSTGWKSDLFYWLHNFWLHLIVMSIIGLTLMGILGYIVYRNLTI